MSTTKQTVKRAFNKADKDKNNQLSLEEMKVALLEIAKDYNEWENVKNLAMVELMMDMVDEDGSKMLTQNELLNLVDLVENGSQNMLFFKMLKTADKNCDGFLSAAELKKLFLTTCPEDSKGDIDDMVESFICMGNTMAAKKVKVEEVMHFLISGGEKADPKDQMKTMFRICDYNGDGFVDIEELIEFFQLFGTVGGSDEKILADMIMKKGDKNKDGKLSYDEFCQGLN